MQYMMDGGSNAPRRRRRTKRRSGPKMVSPKAAAHKRRVEVSGTITVANLAHGMSVKANEVIKKMIGMGQMATLNDLVDFDTATLIAEEFDYEVVNAAFQEDEYFIDVEDEEEDLDPRPPVVTIMGHVDHGKTSLLDAIRSARVADGEAGGITQHISAYQVTRNDELITFIDTPGHAAFTAMRARGAEVTDIVVLVVAADDGVMPQTIEVINHAKAADVEIIVAVNKIDKADAQPDRVKQQLMEHGLVPEEYGGETMLIETSAIQGLGIDALLDAILLISELQEYGANADRHAEGTVIEARLERGKGAVATVLVEHGTLKRGDTIVAGTQWGRVRAVSDFRGKNLKEAGPSTPVEIMGLDGVPNAGDNLVVVASDKDAKALVEHRAEIERKATLAGPRSVSLEDLLARVGEGEIVNLNLIIKADVGGSLEALKGSLNQIDVDGAEIKILHSGVGAVTESDVTLAHTNEAVIMGFNVRPDSKARKAATGFGIEVRTYSVIYEALEDVEKALKGMLAPETKEEVQGTAEIRQTFSVPKIGTVAGCMVTDGKIGRNHDIRLLRDGTIVWTGRLGSLRRFKDDVREVSNGYECGMNLDGFNDIKVGDVIEAFKMVEVARD
jgi:translation initiation factor IF-2